VKYSKLNKQVNNYLLSIFPSVVFCQPSYTQNMDKQTAITLAGSQSELARILGIKRAAVWHWKTIPPLRIYQLKELRPEWFE
jgi:hypothetical protein